MALADLDTSLATIGQPVSGGSAWVSFSDKATLPTDATTKMSTLEGWESLGEFTDDGFTEGKSVSNDTKKGWHGTPLAVITTDESRTYKFVCAEIGRPSVEKLRYGADNVETGTDGSVSAIHDKFGVNTIAPVVLDTLESNGFLHRIVVKKARVTDYDDATYKGTDIVTHGVTITVLDPGDGSAAVEHYRAKPAASTPGK